MTRFASKTQFSKRTFDILRPPVLHHEQRFHTFPWKLGDQFQRRDSADARQTLTVVTAAEESEVDHGVATEADAALDGRQLEVLDGFVDVEKVLVDTTAAEEPDVAVVGYRALGEVVHVEEGALGLGFHRGRDEGDAEETQQFLLMKTKTNMKKRNNNYF